MTWTDGEVVQECPTHGLVIMKDKKCPKCEAEKEAKVKETRQ